MNRWPLYPLLLGGVLATTPLMATEDPRAALGPGFYAERGGAELYLSATTRRMRYDSSSVRLGLVLQAPADSSEPWVALELRRLRWTSGKAELAPVLRWVYPHQVLELGITPSRQLLCGWAWQF
ncbi:MAG: hypothetical protein RLZZ401_1292 [Pseudomonadota bacterium]|jgi:hypothetical protein